MNRKNKNGKNKIRWINKEKKFLNNKIKRREIYENNKGYKTSVKNESTLHHFKNDEKVFDIPGYYYDKEKKRYFSLYQNETFYLNKKEEDISFKEHKKINSILSNFNIIRSCKLKEKKDIIKYYKRTKSLRQANIINIEYEGDKLPNSLYLFYLNKYLLKFDYFNPDIENNNRNTFTNIMIHDVINNKFIKKIVIEEFYNDFIIKEDNLILIDNITKLSIINKINEIIESKDKKIIFHFINKFNIRIDNIERISMVYKWPFININNKYDYYYLIWNNFYYFDLRESINKNDELSMTNNEIIYLSKSQLMKNKNNMKIKKVNIDKKYHYINFFILNYQKDTKNKSPKFYFFTVNGEIHYYKFNKNNIFILNQIIINIILNNIQIINIMPFKYDYNYLIISNKNDIFNFNLRKQTMTKINMDISKNIKNIKYKMKIFDYIDNINCLIYDEDEYINVLSLDDFTIIKKFKYDDYKYNILLINKDYLIII